MRILKTFSNKCLSLSYMGDDWNNNLIHSIIESALYLRTLNHKIKGKETIGLKENLMTLKDKLLVITT